MSQQHPHYLARKHMALPEKTYAAHAFISLRFTPVLVCFLEPEVLDLLNWRVYVLKLLVRIFVPNSTLLGIDFVGLAQ